MSETLQLILKGVWVTIQLSAGGVVLAVIVSLMAGLGRLSRDPILRWLSGIYIEIFRGTSALVQLFWFFYVMPVLIGYSMNPMTVGILVLGLNVGAYGAEVVRGAIQAVPRGQTEAAIALGLTPKQRMRHVILPQALPAILPPAANLLIELVKVSSLASLITIADLTYAVSRIRDHTMQAGLIYGVALVLYFLIALTVSAAVRRLERRVAIQ